MWPWKEVTGRDEEVIQGLPPVVRAQEDSKAHRVTDQNHK